MYCINCGKRLKRGHGCKIAQKYCSYECYQAKPPKVIEIESIFNNNIQAILIDQENKNSNQDTKSALLGISKQTYLKYKRKYLGVIK